MLLITGAKGFMILEIRTGRSFFTVCGPSTACFTENTQVLIPSATFYRFVVFVVHSECCVVMSVKTRAFFLYSTGYRESWSVHNCEGTICIHVFLGPTNVMFYCLVVLGHCGGLRWVSSSVDSRRLETAGWLSEWTVQTYILLRPVMYLVTEAIIGSAPAVHPK